MGGGGVQCYVVGWCGGGVEVVWRWCCEGGVVWCCKVGRCGGGVVEVA